MIGHFHPRMESTTRAIDDDHRLLGERRNDLNDHARARAQVTPRGQDGDISRGGQCRDQARSLHRPLHRAEIAPPKARLMLDRRRAVDPTAVEIAIDEDRPSPAAHSRGKRGRQGRRAEPTGCREDEDHRMHRHQSGRITTTGEGRGRGSGQLEEGERALWTKPRHPT